MKRRGHDLPCYSSSDHPFCRIVSSPLQKIMYALVARLGAFGSLRFLRLLRPLGSYSRDDATQKSKRRGGSSAWRISGGAAERNGGAGQRSELLWLLLTCNPPGAIPVDIACATPRAGRSITMRLGEEEEDWKQTNSDATSEVSSAQKAQRLRSTPSLFLCSLFPLWTHHLGH